MANERRTLENLLAEAKSLAEQHRRIEWLAVAGASIAVLTLTPISSDISFKHDRAWVRVPMPDTWLEAVAALPEISKVGLAFLGDRINDRGFVSIQDALDFLAIEMKTARRRPQAKSMRSPLTKGASMILARVHGYTPGTT